MTNHVIHLIPTNIPPYTLSASDPLSQITQSPPPKASQVLYRKKGWSDRQRWFEQEVLLRIARATHSRLIPWRFQTQNGDKWQLDQGCVGIAMANGVLVSPADPTQVLNYVELNEALWSTVDVGKG